MGESGEGQGPRVSPEAIAQAAKARYELENRGENPDAPEHTGQTTVGLPVVDYSDFRATKLADIAWAKGQVGSKTVTQLAHLRDRAEAGRAQGGLRGRLKAGVAGLEEKLTGIFERKTLGKPTGEVLKPGGIVDQVRGATPLPKNPGSSR